MLYSVDYENLRIISYARHISGELIRGESDILVDNHDSQGIALELILEVDDKEIKKIKKSTRIYISTDSTYDSGKDIQPTKNIKLVQLPDIVRCEFHFKWRVPPKLKKSWNGRSDNQEWVILFDEYFDNWPSSDLFSIEINNPTFKEFSMLIYEGRRDSNNILLSAKKIKEYSKLNDSIILRNILNHPSSSEENISQVIRSADGDFEILYLLADDRNVHPGILHEIINNKTTPLEALKNVTRNPNLSKEDMQVLVDKPRWDDRHKEEVLGLCENKYASELIIQNIYTKIKSKINKNSEYDYEVSSILKKLLSHHKLSEKNIKELYENKNISDEYKTEIEEALCKNNNTPIDILNELIKERENHRHIAKNEKINDQIVTQLMKSEEWGVKDELASNPSTPQKILHLLSKEEELHYNISLNKNLDEKMIKILLKSDDPQNIERVASNPFADFKNIKSLLKSKNEEALIGLAWNPSCDEDTFRSLEKVKDNYYGLTDIIALNPATPIDVLHKIPKQEYCHSLSRNISSPSDLLDQFIKNEKYDNDIKITAVWTSRYKSWLTKFKKNYSYYFKTVWYEDIKIY